MPIPCFDNTCSVNLSVDPATGALIADANLDPAGGLACVDPDGVGIWVPAVKVFLSPTGAHSHLSGGAGGADQRIFWDSENYDTTGTMFTLGDPTKLVAPIDGLYFFEANARFVYDAGGDQRYTGIRKNGVATRLFRSGNGYESTAPSPASSNITVGTIQLAALDYIEIVGFQDSGGGLLYQDGDPDSVSGASWAGLRFLSRI